MIESTEQMINHSITPFDPQLTGSECYWKGSHKNYKAIEEIIFMQLIDDTTNRYNIV
jgi:hypothetical protein